MKVPAFVASESSERFDRKASKVVIILGPGRGKIRKTDWRKML